MKASEFIIEKISITPIQHELESNIEQWGDIYIPKHVAEEFVDNTLIPIYKNPNEMKDYKNGKYIFGQPIWEYAISSLSDIIMKLTHMDNIKILLVDDQYHKALGSATYRNKDNFHVVDINCGNLFHDLYNTLVDNLSYSGGFHQNDDSTSYVLDRNEAIASISSMQLYSFKFFDYISDRIPTIVHELVHVMQHQSQQHRDNTEYRSTLTKKNKNRFIHAINAIHNNQATDEDRKIYYSSIQEIPAHAHSVVSKIIQGYFSWVYNLDDETNSEIKSELIKLKNDFPKKLKYNDTWNYYHHTFNVPSNPSLYNIYKRFNKAVYQEFHHYLNHWYNRISPTPWLKPNMERYNWR